MEATESRVQWLVSSDGHGSFLSAGLLHGYDQDRTVPLDLAPLGPSQSQSPADSANPAEPALYPLVSNAAVNEKRESKRENKLVNEAKAKSKSVRGKASSSSSSSSSSAEISTAGAAPGTTVQISTATHTNKYVGDKLSCLSYAHDGVLAAGLFSASQENAVLVLLSRLLLPGVYSSYDKPFKLDPARIDVSAEALMLAFAAAAVQGVFTFFVAAHGECCVAQRLLTGAACQFAQLAAAAVTYRVADLFVSTPEGAEARSEHAVLCNSFWAGDHSIAPAAQTKAKVAGSHATSTVFLRRELFFALDRYIGSSADETRRIVFAITNKVGSAVTVNSMFPKYPPEAVDAFRAASDEASILEMAKQSKIGKPKGYVAGFNLWVQGVRAKIVKEKNVKKMSNNEVNKVLGERWKALPNAQRAPYEEQAKQDKLRYMSEVREYNASAYEHVAPRLKSGESDTLMYRQSTAYAQFMAQDRLFAMRGPFSALALNQTQNQHQNRDPMNFLAKYLSARWQGIMPEEKELYECSSLLVSRMVKNPPENADLMVLPTANTDLLFPSDALHAKAEQETEATGGKRKREEAASDEG